LKLLKETNKTFPLRKYTTRFYLEEKMRFPAVGVRAARLEYLMKVKNNHSKLKARLRRYSRTHCGATAPSIARLRAGKRLPIGSRNVPPPTLTYKKKEFK